MKRVKKMVAMATVMTMVFNVVMPIGVLAKENTNEYGVLAKNGANFSGSGQIIGDIVINNGTFKYSNSATKHVTGTAHVAPEVKVDEPAQGYIPIEVSEMGKELYSGLFNTNNYPDENSEYFKKSTSEYKDGTQSVYIGWQTNRFDLTDNAYLDTVSFYNGQTFEIHADKNQTTVVRVKHLNVGGEVKVSGDGYVVLYVDELSGGNPGSFNAGGDSSKLTVVFTGKNAGYNNFKEVNANTIAMNATKYTQVNGIFAGNVYTSGNLEFSGDSSITGKVYAPASKTVLTGSTKIYGQLITDTLEISGGAVVSYKATNGLPSEVEKVVGNLDTENGKTEDGKEETTKKEEVTKPEETTKPSETTKPDSGNDNKNDDSDKESIEVSVIVPLKMSIRLQDGTVLNNKSSFKIELDKEIKFQMCSNNWDNDTYDDNGNGIAGTVVYTAVVSSTAKKNTYDAASRTFTIAKGDKVLRTDTNNCFMAYRFYFKKGNYNKQTGINSVVNTPLESLSVNLPLGSTITCDAYKEYSRIDSADVFIETADDKTICYKDYYWEY